MTDPARDNVTELPKTEPAAIPERRKRGVFFWMRIVLLLALLAGLGFWANQWAQTSILFVHETDARVRSDLIMIAGRVEGAVIGRPVVEGQRIAKGDVLVRIDQRDAELAIGELEAEAKTIESQLSRLDAEIMLVTAQVESRIRSEQSKLSAAEATRALRQHELEYSQSEYRRIESLAKTGAASASKLDREHTDYLTARQELVRAEAEIATINATIEEAATARGEVAMLRGDQAVLKAKLAELAARSDRRRNDIVEHTVLSPVDGVIDKIFIDVGEYAAQGQRLMVVHDPSQIWVETNIRETDIGRVEVGQKAKVVVDAYPGEPFQGTVERIGQAVTSQFALLPKLNEAGSFTKVTQRVAVRIAVEQRGGKLKPGMMVEVFIEGHDKKLF
ncbi:MAG: HlyD family secretion protein [Rhodospirillaceae bacterium]|jgi:membrane fusion protein, multidrug efflux system|nr:HlyD family secretion protein [Rhodospirillaceae bacterium]